MGRAAVYSWALLAVLAIFAACAASQSNRTVPVPEINSSILVFGPSDYLLNGGQSRCQQMVKNALLYKQSRLMFVPTAFWVDEGYASLKTVNSQGKVSYFCLNRTQGNGTTPSSCKEATQDDINQLSTNMAACFKTAIDAGLGISISPHMDDGLGFGGWRNGLIFDPLEKYGTWSYADFFLYPLADALAQSVSPSTEVLFAMQGEMSATVVYFPKSYMRLLQLLKDRVIANRTSIPSSNIQVGVSTNFNKLCGCVLQDVVDTYQYVREFPAAFAPLKSQFDLPSLLQLYTTTDFIGISSYPSLTPNFTTNQLEAATEQFDFEIGQFGINLTDLIYNKGRKLFWNEYGVGGGSNQNGQVKAATAELAAANPYFGVFGPYKRSTDPWVLYDLSQPSAVRDYMRYFYNQTAAYAQQTGKNPKFKYIVSGIFLWNDASWDIQAIYPSSTSDEGSYRDPTLIPLINNHNTFASGGLAAQVPAGGVTPVSPPSPGTNPGGSVKPSATLSAGRRLL